MEIFTCPVCGGSLTAWENSLRCEQRHTYDIARKGYVNFLLSQSSSAKRHGDDKLMVQARTRFLDRGYYLPLREALLETVGKYAGKGMRLADAGCGEGWYTDALERFLQEKGVDPVVCGLDISKEALIAGHRRNPRLHLAVASLFHLPLGDGEWDGVVNIFAPHAEEEFARVLREGGLLFRVIPLEEHLMGLKRAIYAQVRKNVVDSIPLERFELLERVDVRGNIHVEGQEDIQALFRMTPYYYKTGVEDQEKLLNLDELDTEVEFAILVYRKK